MNEVFPDPQGPKTPTTSPCVASKLSVRRAKTSAMDDHSKASSLGEDIGLSGRRGGAADLDVIGFLAHKWVIQFPSDVLSIPLSSSSCSEIRSILDACSMRGQCAHVGVQVRCIEWNAPSYGRYVRVANTQARKLPDREAGRGVVHGTLRHSRRNAPCSRTGTAAGSAPRLPWAKFPEFARSLPSRLRSGAPYPGGSVSAIP